MDIDRLKTAWRKQPLEGSASRSLDEMMKEVRDRAARFNWRVTKRDLIDTVACLAIVGIVGPYFWRAPQVLEKVGAAVVMAGAVWIIVRLSVIRSRHRRLPVDATAREFCANEMKRLDEQMHLISTAAISGAGP